MTKKHSNILVIDVGGTHVKLFCTGQPEAVKVPSGPEMTARKMVALVKKAVAKWKYTAISIGYPGQVVHHQPVAEPHNLASGWVGFDFEKAVECPVRVINDAAMQALGSYEGGRMLFLGLGTGLGSAMIVDGALEPMELAHLPYKRGRTYEDYVGERGLERLGKKKWRKAVTDVVLKLKTAMGAAYVVLGGGNARLVEKLPENVRLGANVNAFQGGVRLWQGATALISASVQQPAPQLSASAPDDAVVEPAVTEHKDEKHGKKHKGKKAKKAHHAEKLAKASKNNSATDGDAQVDDEKGAKKKKAAKAGKAAKPATAANGKADKKGKALASSDTHKKIMEMVNHVDDEDFDDDEFAADSNEEEIATNGLAQPGNGAAKTKAARKSKPAHGSPINKKGDAAGKGGRPVKPEISIVPDLAALHWAAAAEFIAAVKHAVDSKGQFDVVLSGGSTPKGLFALLADNPKIPWRQVRFFWGDERHVAPEHADSNFRMANEALLSKINAQPSQIFRIPAENPDAAQAAAGYEQQLRECFQLSGDALPRFDLVMLGMGSEGHVASLFPGTKALDENERLVVSNWVGKLFTDRITLTARVLNNAAMVMQLVSGSDKALALKGVLEGPTEPAQLPAQLIRPVDGRLLWLIEKSAGALLQSA